MSVTALEKINFQILLSEVWGKVGEFNKERIGEIINKVQKLISDIEKELKIRE